ncbi:MAG: hypothetical protein JWL97_3831 [Gemmatimonadales bacterium]|nr:hypothetical protein [Gemmatimonadales bacterium]
MAGHQRSAWPVSATPRNGWVAARTLRLMTVDNNGRPPDVRRSPAVVTAATAVVGVVAVGVVVWVLGPGAVWVLHHLDGINGKTLSQKDKADALDAIRGRVITIATGILAIVAVYYTARNAASARRTAQAAQDGVEAARRSAEVAEAAQLRTFQLTQEGQRQSEEAQRKTHELTERGQLTDRFTAAVAQLGDTSPAVQLGGVHALAGIADDAPTRTLRQTCIDVLCAYLRLPYDPEPEPLAEDQESGPTDAQRAAHAQQTKAYRALREVRHTIIRLIGDHLRLDADDRRSWQGHDFDFTDVVFDGGDLHGADFSAGTTRFTGAVFSGGTVNFMDAKFSGSTVNFMDAEFSGGTVSFGSAEFSGGTVDFWEAKFSGSTVNFMDAKFSGGTVSFEVAKFSGGTVGFGFAKFSGGTVYFEFAKFSGGTVNFEFAKFSGGTVGFEAAKFSGGTVGFRSAKFSGSTVNFLRAEFSGGTVNFVGADFEGGTVTFTEALGSPPEGLVRQGQPAVPGIIMLPPTWLRGEAAGGAPT